MKMKTIVRRVSVVVLLASTALAKDKPRIVIEVVETQTSERPTAYTIPGSESRSNTNCNGNSTAINSGGGMVTANGTANCTTTTTPGTPATTVTGYIQQAHVRAIMPDGRHITLGCQAGFRTCHPLDAGHYDAEVDGNNVWMFGHDLGGKEHKVKYRYEGSW